MRVEEIHHSHVDGGEGLLAIVVTCRPDDRFPPGVRFVTSPDVYLQLACMRHATGTVIEPHTHLPVVREVLRTQEVLLIRSGKVRVDFFAESREFAASRILEAGDMVLLIHGGHGFDVIEEAELVEIKQGPYPGRDRDKIPLKEKVPIAAVRTTGG